MGRVGVGCDTWMKNVGMDEDICTPINASMRMGILKLHVCLSD
jgi:hypothetical protein